MSAARYTELLAVIGRLRVIGTETAADVADGVDPLKSWILDPIDRLLESMASGIDGMLDEL